MKNLFNDISQDEKNRILEMHSGKKNVISEQESFGGDVLRINQDGLGELGSYSKDKAVGGGMDEDLIYDSTYIKGRGNKKVDNFRILMTGANTGKKYFMYLMPTNNGEYIAYLHLDSCKEVGEGHYKFKSFNYYFFRNNSDDVEQLLQKWFYDEPVFGRFNGKPITDIEDYTYVFEYKDKQY